MKAIKMNSLITVFQVKDIDKSIEWYKKWLGDPDVLPGEGVAEYEIMPGAWLQLSESEYISTSSIVIGADDVKESKLVLDKLGIQTGEIKDYQVIHLFDIYDTDNNQISFVEEL